MTTIDPPSTHANDKPVPSDSVSPEILGTVDFVTCDNTILQIECPTRFQRRLVPDDQNTPNQAGIRFNDAIGEDSDLGKYIAYYVHCRNGSSDQSDTDCKNFSIYHIQQPASGANVFNSIYWPACDGSLQNSLGHRLMNVEGFLQHKLFRARLKDVLMLRQDFEEPAPAPTQEKASRTRDEVLYQKLKDCFVDRII